MQLQVVFVLMKYLATKKKGRNLLEKKKNIIYWDYSYFIKILTDLFLSLSLKNPVRSQKIT